MNTGAVAVIGAALAAVTLALRVPHRRDWTAVAGCGAVVAAAVAALADDVAVLAPAWMAAAVFVSARTRPTDVRTAAGVLGDALTAGSLVLVAIDTGEGALAAPAPWAAALFAAGLCLRAGATGMREPGLLVLACAVGARLSAGGLEGLDAPGLVAFAAVAAVLAWAEGPLAALPVLAVSVWGVGHPAATEAAIFLFAGAGVAAAGVAAAGAPAVGSRWGRAVTEGPPVGVTAAGLALLAAVPGAAGLLQVPLGRSPEGVVATGATLAVLGAAGSAAGGRRLRPEALSVRALATLAAAVLLALALLTPGGYAEALDAGTAHGSMVAAALERTRDGLVAAGAFAAVVTGLLLTVSRLRGS